VRVAPAPSSPLEHSISKVVAFHFSGWSGSQSPDRKLENMVVRKMQNVKFVWVGMIAVLLFPIIKASGQTRVQPVPAATVQPVPSAEAQKDAAPAAVPSTYLLGPDDQLVIQGPEVDEIVNKPYRIDPEGYVSLPMLGKIKAAGLTLGEFETQLNRTASKFIREPQLVVSIGEFHSQPVSVVGAVNQPGTQQLQGKKTLMQMISMVGGFRPDAGNTLKITRDLQWGPLPLPNASTDSSGKFSVAEVRVPDLLQGKNPQLNILVMPNDVITIPSSETVYVVGDVHKAGGFLLGERQNMSVLQALAMSEGISGTSDAKHSRIIHRAQGSTEQTETPVDVKRILQGKAQDVPLDGGDILFVPGSMSKKVGLRTVEAAIQTATGLAIWRF
jgi:polysaccharide export outer membrane protein